MFKRNIKVQLMAMLVSMSVFANYASVAVNAAELSAEEDLQIDELMTEEVAEDPAENAEEIIETVEADETIEAVESAEADNLALDAVESVESTDETAATYDEKFTVEANPYPELTAAPILEFELRNGEELGKAIERALASEDIERPESNSVMSIDSYGSSSSYSSSGKVTVSGDLSVTTSNNYTYIGNITPKKKGAPTFYVRIPRWYVNAFPQSKWYLDNNGKTCKVVVALEGKNGNKTVKFSKTLKLTSDSRYWLGGWNDYDYELILPPWIRMIFPEEEIILQDGTDEKFGSVLTFNIRAWKNASARKKGVTPIMKQVFYKDSSHYRIRTLTGNDAKMPKEVDGNSDIIIE